MATKATTTSKSQSNGNGNAMKESPSKKMTPNQQSMGSDSRLQEFFHDEIKDIYWAEKHLVKTLPKMHKAASSPELKNAIAEHLDVTRGHVERLEEVFSLLGKKPQAKKCEAMEGITKEGESIIEDTEAGTATRDVGIIMAAQKVEHYEIATYGGLAQLAKTLGKDEVAGILQSTLDEEKEADENLSKLAESRVNESAAAE
ncbi:ferritin-like domain-containing protein [Ferruginibacter paludis]|uniref:YciE/YciF ferroxidase family protein n=1 Tax=Ferruginibacter paludis TaxID=1310417 RepID=UPI0025B475C5|nr:ferritin-like domain-containing protein [Ferruginibacter paludis]MDN3656439.1 ferritin-like domain-containing protein [Ferruginibacter paludis]